MDALVSFESIKQQLYGKKLLLMLDFDGTISPIAPTPQDAVIDKNIQNTLQKFSRKENVYIAIVSGRELNNIQEKVGIPDIIYAGSHGFTYSIFGQTKHPVLPEEMQVKLPILLSNVKKLAQVYKGVWVENKGLTIAVYYQALADDRALSLEQDIKKILATYNKYKKNFSLTYGKNVFEITPNVGKNKGTVSRIIVEMVHQKSKQPIVPLYIGDDLTDEHAFKHLSEGVTIHVGKNNHTEAKYTLKDTKEVHNFLLKLSQVV